MPATLVPSVAPGLVAPVPNTQTPANARGLIPWRKATLRKTELAISDTGTIAAAGAQWNRVLEGTGFLEGVTLEIVATAAANAAAVAYQPDAPWSAFTSIVFKDVGPDTINLSGYGLYLANLYGGYGLTGKQLSADTSVYQLLGGAVGAGGSFRGSLVVPLAINDRNLIGIMGNQDRAVKYELRSDVAGSAAIYTVNPTALPPYIINRTMRFATVPTPVGAGNQPNEQLPPHYGVIHMLTQLRSESAPVTASTINHFLRSVGNTIRYIILVFRDSTGARADTLLPTRLTFRVGADAVFSESGAHRRQVMFDRYGFDAPAGVLVYDFLRDFELRPGFELGDDWLNTRDVANAQFEITYPTFAATPGTLDVITDSLVIPDGMDISAYV